MTRPVTISRRHNSLARRCALWLASFAALVLASAPGRCDAGVPSLFTEVHGDVMAANSALYATAFTLRFYRKTFRTRALAKHLGLGRAWMTGTKIGEISSALRAAGLRVGTMKVRSFKSLMAYLYQGPNRAAIIRVKKWRVFGAHSRHFAVLLPVGNRRCLLADVGVYTAAVSERLIGKILLRRIGHRCLVVRPGGSPAAGPLVHLSDAKVITVDAGDVAAGPGMFVARFRLKNDGDAPVAIGVAKGTCFCFRGARILGKSQTILPGSVGTVALSFDRRDLGAGAIVRVATIAFTGTPPRIVTVVVRCDISESRHSAQLTWFPERVSTGILRPPITAVSELITVLVPKGVTVGAPTISGKFAAIVRSAPLNRADKFGRVIERFNIKLRPTRPGPFRVVVRFRTSDIHVPKIAIPITGAVRR